MLVRLHPESIDFFSFMKKIPLNKSGKGKQGLFALVDDEDFEKLNKHLWHPVIHPTKKTIYAATNHIKPNLMHRLILGLTNPKELGDHADHDGLNNQKYNLRKCTISQNNANRTPKGKSKYLGVSWHLSGKKWNATIKKDNKTIYLGAFINEEEAAIAYNKKALELHGEFANLNVILQSEAE